MDNASLIGLSRQVVLRRELDLIANNVANVNTPGYRGQSLMLGDVQMPLARASTHAARDRLLDFVVDRGSRHDFAFGPIVTTGNPLDIAIEGDGWLVVETPGGDRYTRAGNLTIDSTGRLVTASGHPVLSEGGAIVFAPGEAGIVIARDGTISTNAGDKGRLQLVAFADERTLLREGDNLFAGENPEPAAGATIRQGALEGSNVNAVLEMTRLIEVTRTYEQVARLLQRSEDMRSRALERLGRLDA